MPSYATINVQELIGFGHNGQTVVGGENYWSYAVVNTEWAKVVDVKLPAGA